MFNRKNKSLIMRIEAAMKPFQITTRNRTSASITRSLLVAGLITFFVAGHADARSKKPPGMRAASRYDAGSSAR
jgi:hypothetical protein